MVPSIAQVELATTALLRKARKDGELHDLTVRKVRQILEDELLLQPGTLEAKEFKTAIKDIIVTKLSESNGQEGTQGEQPSKQSNSEVSPRTNGRGGRKEDGKVQKGADKRKQKGRKAGGSSTNELEPAAEDSTLRNALSMPPKAKLTKEKSKDKPKPSKADQPESGKFKSKAVVESSEDEDKDEKEAQQPPSPSRANKEVKSVKEPPTKRKNASPTKITTPAKSEANGNQGPVASSSTLAGPSSHPEKVIEEDGAESDLSSVIDEPPKKRQKKGKDAEKQGDSQKSSRGKKAKEPLSKDEETVTKLKAVVVACGVRKTWKKEFQGLEKPKQQIKRLHEMLADLGMTPRYTIEKAKAIKHKREFRQELQDIQEFEQAQRRKERKGQESVSDNASGESSEAEDAPIKARKTARASIQAFLDDQSDEE